MHSENLAGFCHPVAIPLLPLRYQGRKSAGRQPRHRPCGTGRQDAGNKRDPVSPGRRRRDPSDQDRSRIIRLASDLNLSTIFAAHPVTETQMAAEPNPLAGKTAPPSMLVNVPRLMTAYFTGRPDPNVAAQRVAFGTSGHRGSSLNDAFNEAHILAISQAICEYRHGAGITGPLFIGIDTHALSTPALASALEVLAANDVTTMIDRHDGYTPTPVISHAILTTNRNRTSGLADGVVITPSHNPPEDGGFK